MDSILDTGAKFLPQTNRKRLQQKTAGWTDMVAAQHREFRETSDIFTRADEEDFYDRDELKLRAKELAQDRPDIMDTIRPEGMDNDTYINSDPIAVINSIRPEVMDEMKELAREKLKAHIEAARENTQIISQQYGEGGGGFWGELGAGLLAYSGTGEGIAQLILGGGLSAVVGSTTRAGAVTAANMGKRALRVGTAEGIISAGLEIPLAVSEYNRDMQLGLDPEYARTNMALRLLAAPTFGFGAGAGISYLVDKIRFRGGTKAIISESGKQQIYRAFEITEGRIGALEVLNGINQNKGKVKGDDSSADRAARWADEIERTGTISIKVGDLEEPQKALIQLVDDEVIEVGPGGTTEKTNIQNPDKSARKEVEIETADPNNPIVKQVKDEDQIIIGQEPGDVFILPKEVREKHNINKGSMVLFHGSLKPWDADNIDMYKYIGTGEGTDIQYAGLYASPSQEAAETYTSGWRGFRKVYGKIIPPMRPRLYKIEVDNPKWIADKDVLPEDIRSKLDDLQNDLDADYAFDGNKPITAGFQLNDLFHDIIQRYGGGMIMVRGAPQPRNAEAIKAIFVRISKGFEKLGYTGIKTSEVRGKNMGANEYTIFNKSHIKEITDAKRGKIIYNRPADIIEESKYKVLRLTEENIEDYGLSEGDIINLRKNAVISEKTDERGAEVETLYFGDESTVGKIADDLMYELDDNTLFTVREDEINIIKARFRVLLKEKFPRVDDAEIERRVNEIDKAKVKQEGAVITYNLANASDVWLINLTHPEELYGNGAYINQIGMKLDDGILTTINIDDDGITFMGSKDGGRLVREKLTELFHESNEDGLLEHSFIHNKKPGDAISKIVVLSDIDESPREYNRVDIDRLAAEYSNSRPVLFDSGKDGNVLFIKGYDLVNRIGIENIAKIAIANKIRADITMNGIAPKLVISKALLETFTTFGEMKGLKKKINREKVIREVIDLDDDIDFMGRVGIKNYTKIINALDLTAENEGVYSKIQYYTRAIYKDADGKKKSAKQLKREIENFISALLYKADENKGTLVMNESDVKFYRLAASEIDYDVGIILAAKNLIKIADRNNVKNYNAVRAKAFITALYQSDFDNFDKDILEKLSQITNDTDLQNYMYHNIEKAPFDYDEGKIVVGNKLFNILENDDGKFKGVEKTEAAMYKGKPLESIPILEDLQITSGGNVKMNVLYGGGNYSMDLIPYNVKKVGLKWVVKKYDDIIGEYNSDGAALSAVIRDKYGEVYKHNREFALPLNENMYAHTDMRTNEKYYEQRIGETINLTDDNGKLLARFENNESGQEGVIDYLNSRNLIADDVDNNKKLQDDFNACMLKVGG